MEEYAYSLISQANNEMIDIWLNYILFSWQWWLVVTLSIVPWILWIIFRKKNSTNRLLFAGLIMILISSWLDNVGILFGLWSYYYNAVPFSPAFIPWDFTLLPVTLMFFLQIKPRIKPIYKAILFSVFSTYIAEPIIMWLGLYNPKHWELIYSFPIYIIIYLICDWASRRSNFARVNE